MKKLIVPIFAIATIFTSCEKDNLQLGKDDIKTTSVTMAMTEGKNNMTGKNVAYGVVNGSGLEQSLTDILFEFNGLQLTTKNFTTDIPNSFTVDNVSLGGNNITVTAKTFPNSTGGAKQNSFNTTFDRGVITNLESLTTALDNEKRPYLEYSTTTFANIQANINTLNIELLPYTGRIATAFRLSDFEANNGFSYTITAINNGLTSVPVIGNLPDELTGVVDAHNVTLFLSSGEWARTMTGLNETTIQYEVDLYQGSTFVKHFTLVEKFLDGKSINTLYQIDKNAILKQSETITLSAKDLEAIPVETPVE